MMMKKVQDLFEPSSPAYLHTHRDSKVLPQAYFHTLRKGVYTEKEQLHSIICEN
jgi:hypothetical protein